MRNVRNVGNEAPVAQVEHPPGGGEGHRVVGGQQAGRAPGRQVGDDGHRRLGPRLVLVADEPIAHQNQAWAEATTARGTACLLATHNPVAFATARRVFDLRDGRLVPHVPHVPHAG